MNTEFQRYLDEALPQIDTELKPTKYKITIEEHISGVFEVEATDIGKAMEIAREKYKMGIFVVEPDGYPTAKLMMAEDEYGVECTEWEEFE